MILALATKGNIVNSVLLQPMTLNRYCVTHQIRYNCSNSPHACSSRGRMDYTPIDLPSDPWPGRPSTRASSPGSRRHFSTCATKSHSCSRNLRKHSRVLVATHVPDVSCFGWRSRGHLLESVIVFSHFILSTYLVTASADCPLHWLVQQRKN